MSLNESSSFNKDLSSHSLMTTASSCTEISSQEFLCSEDVMKTLIDTFSMLSKWQKELDRKSKTPPGTISNPQKN